MWLVFQHASNKLDMKGVYTVKGIRRKTRGCYGTTDIPKKRNGLTFRLVRKCTTDDDRYN